MPSIRTRAVSLLVGAAAFGAVAVPASASTNVVIQVQILAKKFSKDKDVKAVQTTRPKSIAQLKALLPKYEHVEKEFRAAATTVSKSSANTANQRKGRTQWVTGARTFANGLHQFDTSVEALLHGDKTAEKQVIAADKTLAKGDKLLAAANKTLGLG
jgi:hypothetical protein